jgi:hypothetical protein
VKEPEWISYEFAVGTPERRHLWIRVAKYNQDPPSKKTANDEEQLYEWESTDEELSHSSSGEDSDQGEAKDAESL